jgi:acyl-CoA synthetase (AMP-forming)/AMP-acid ligase II
MLDHFGGFNTLLSVFAYGGMGVCLPSRIPEVICRAIEESKADLLPTTPTFINLLLASRCYKSFDLSSVKLITYGTEVMAPATLNKLRQVFPNAKIKQTYGLSELGVLRSKSENDDSVWVKVGGTGFETKIIDNILWVRSEANMIGYLNAPNPFDEEGWMCTGDQVEVRGDYIRILGRKSDMINVGGQKVFPAEVEDVLLEDDNVVEATVVGISHPMMGNIIKAKITLLKDEPIGVVRERLRAYCLTKMAKYKIPVKFEFLHQDKHANKRFKKVRRDN